MYKNYDYERIADINLKNIQKSFSNQKSINKKLIPYFFDKPGLLLNKSDKLSPKTFKIKDDITNNNNNQYEEKIYDGKKLSKSIHKKLDYFNKTHIKNISLYKMYKSKYEFFSKQYNFFKYLNKSTNDIKNNDSEAIMELISEYKRKKNITIDIKSFNKDIFNNSALVENNLNHLKFFYILNPSKFIKRNNSKNEKSINFNEPYTFDNDNIKHLKAYQFIKKIKLLSKIKYRNFFGNSYNDINELKSHNQNDDDDKELKTKSKNQKEQTNIINDSINSELIKDEIEKTKSDINILNKSLKLLNEEINSKNNNNIKNSNNDLSDKFSDFSLINNSNTSRYLKFNQLNKKIPDLNYRIKNRNIFHNFGYSTKYSEVLNHSDLFPKIKNQIIYKLEKTPKNENNNESDIENKINNNINNEIVSNKKYRLIKSKTTDNIFKNVNLFLKKKFCSTPTLQSLYLNLKSNIEQDKQNEEKNFFYIKKKEPKTEDLYKFAKKNIGKLRKKDIRESFEKILKHKKKFYNQNSNEDYFQYLKMLSKKIIKFDIKESMKKTYSIMGQKMIEEKRSKIDEVGELEEKIKNKENELLYSLLLKKAKKNISELKQEDNIL